MQYWQQIIIQSTNLFICMYYLLMHVASICGVFVKIQTPVSHLLCHSAQGTSNAGQCAA